MESLDVHIGLWGDKKDIQTILNKEQNLASAKRAERLFIALRAQGDQRLEKRDQKIFMETTLVY